MPASTRKRPSTGPAMHYRGKQTRTGNSSGFRFEGALFKSHPEFNGQVIAQIIAPGRMLVTAAPAPHNADPVMQAFLGFLAQDMTQSPHKIQPLDPSLGSRLERLIGGISVDPETPLEDEVDLG